MKKPTSSADGGKEKPITITTWKGTDNIDHYMRKTFVRYPEGACIYKFLSWFDFFAGIADFIEQFNIPFHGRPEILTTNALGHGFDAEVIEVQSVNYLRSLLLRNVWPRRF